MSTTRQFFARSLIIGLLVFSSADRAQPQTQAQLVLNKNDHIAIIGNTMAERLQHDAWFESYVNQAFPESNLTIRNLGFSADTLTVRLRSAGFGSPDEWLTRCQADVVIAMFGYNESWGGVAGIAQFRSDLVKFIERTQSQSYNGKSQPRVAIVGPAPLQIRDNPYMPPTHVEDVNRMIQLYSGVMREVSEQHNVPFVDLSATDFPTINGLHLTSEGNRRLAGMMVARLFGLDTSDLENRQFAAVHEAVLDKNWHWFHRYRTTDGYSTFGGRADLAFTDGQTNRVVMDRELEILDWMVAERDKRIWALVQGKDYVVDDAKSPEFLPVISNKPGPLPGGKHVFLSGEEAIEKMEVHPGLQVNLFACEQQFPELASPVQMAFDTRGRLWVAVWPSYPHWKPKDEMNDKLLIFSDTSGDGRADSMQVFADGLHNPSGFEFWNGGVLVAQQPDIWFLKDTTGDDVADLRVRVLHGIDSADTHHAANSFVLGPDGGLYFQEGTFHHSQIESPWGPPVRCVNAGVYRFEPRTHKVDTFISYPFANPHGHVFDAWGQNFVTDGTGNVNYFAAPFSGKVQFPNKHGGYFPFFEQWVRPSGATEIMVSRHFPPEFQNNYLIANVIGFQGILNYRVADDGSGFSAVEAKPILRSSDPNFRPVDIEIGPDGAIYFLDWQNPIIGHMQHNLRDPNRDREHGRVYRVTHSGRELLENLPIHGASVPQLLDMLSTYEDRGRYRVRIELSNRDSDEVIDETNKWLSNLDKSSPIFPRLQLEALWIHQQHDVVNEELLGQVFSSEEFRARAAAIRVLSYWLERVSGYLEILAAAAVDESPRVRLEAVRACSYVDAAVGAEIALQVLNFPMDRFLEYALKETIDSLEPKWLHAMVSGEPFSTQNARGLRYLLKRIDTYALLKVNRSRPVYEELLSRPGVVPETRIEAAAKLAELNQSSVAFELLSAIERLDTLGESGDTPVLADLAHVFAHGSSNTNENAGFHGTNHVISERDIDRLKRMTTSAKQSITRQIAFAILVASRNEIDSTWHEAAQNPSAFADFVRSIPLMSDLSLRQAFFPKLRDILKGDFPEPIAEQVNPLHAPLTRYVRIELPGERRTLTLAEVEVMVGERNVARSGTATQSGTAHGGTADRGIDGNRSGIYGRGGQTHTPEDSANPWWEVDLGVEMPVDRVIIWNRTEADFGKRLEGFTLRTLDGNRNVVFEQQHVAAPRREVAIPIKGNALGQIERAAIETVPVTLSGLMVPELTEIFDLLSTFVLENRHRDASIRALARLPRNSWNQSVIPQLIESALGYVGELDAADRTHPSVLDELALAKNLSGMLARDVGDKYRHQLSELGVNVIVLRPITHMMQYDRSQIFVEAGKPVQIVFENTDIMPHNIVFTAPGAYAKVGIASEEMASAPDAIDRQFVPNLPEVLFASKMLQPGQTQVLNVTAPETAGEYPYVCTYPGHWRRMYGTMHVVEDLDALPVEVVSPTVDVAVSTRPFVRQWTLEDLTESLASIEEFRSFERGKNLFAEMSCQQCHKIGPDDLLGGEVGPSIQDILAKLVSGDIDRLEILRSIVDPSEKIEEKYRTIIVQDFDGRVYSGVVAERNDEYLRLLANPLDKQAPVTLMIEDIEDEKESKISIMPAGLLNTLRKEEILDLLMYIESAGNPQHKAYRE
ncbi:MAG TPA: GDSL-type esterase/lipase family protein [Pirellulaceae bacterium]|nr:GDSL-type esterase/lipase family protein [Pirellulaceae bacterium]HMP69796.1 GDSL-type esterase/lipase family protein [Pirellulaceae bacterium]